jgi:hypothetical protein
MTSPLPPQNTTGGSRGDFGGMEAAPFRTNLQPLTNATTPLAGITTEADVANPCIGPPFAWTPFLFPATHGLTQLSYTSLLNTSFQKPATGNPKL